MGSQCISDEEGMNPLDPAKRPGLGTPSLRRDIDLMTQDELIEFLRIPEVSNAKDYRYVIDNLKRMRHLPRVHICGKPLYPRKAILAWIENQTEPQQ